MNTLQFASRARVIQSRQEMRVEAVKVRRQQLRWQLREQQWQPAA